MKLHAYQAVARDFLLDNPRSALYLAPGLGKSAITLAALTRQHLPALVVAPKRVATLTWPAETRSWRPDLSFALAQGTPAQRKAALAAGADVTVLGRDSLADVRGSRQYRTLVLDESHGFKSRSTERWKLARTIPTTHLWQLTGSPAPNGLMDLWAQLALLDGGERLGRTLTAFRDRFFTPGKRGPNGVVYEWLLKPGAADRIHERIADICLSMDAVEVLVPPVTYNTVPVELPDRLRAMYDDLKRDLVVQLDLLGSVSAANAAVLTSKLAQVSAGFLYTDTVHPLLGPKTVARRVRPPTADLHDAKLDALREITDEAGSPVLVFHRFTHERDRILQAFPVARTLDESGVFDAWNRGEVPMLVAHPASAGHGLNLQHGGSTIVWTSPTWSLEEWAQANARLIRQGQRHPVVVHSLLAERTIDAAMLLRVREKMSVQDALLAYLTA